MQKMFVRLMSLLLRLQRLAAEFRRRRVFRAAAVYLAAVFIVLQVGDIIIEPLGLPGWTMVLLIVLSAAGFALTLALTWVYELTPEGVRRTPAAEDATRPAAHTATGAAARVTLVEGRRLAITAALVLAVLGGGWIAAATLSHRLAVDPASQAIAVLPFRVAGAGAELDYMREGIVDLLSALLADRAELPVVPPRVLLRELGDAEPDSDRRTTDMVRRLGAMRMITGEVIGRADHVTLTATLHDLRTGRTVHATATGAERALDDLVERLAAQLVARENPLTTDRLASLEGVPLAALRHYLHALSLQRRGRFGDSMEPLRQAIAIDSSFALAALAFDVAAGWASADPDEVGRMQRLAWENRERLNAMDRLHLEAQIWTYPDITAPAVRLRRLERALTTLPERHELWYEYGDLLVHEGQAIGAADWRERARAAFERALVVAPDHIESNYHLAELAYEAGDTAAMEAAARILEREDAALGLSGLVKALRALAYDDSASWHNLRTLGAADLGSALIGVGTYAGGWPGHRLAARDCPGPGAPRRDRCRGGDPRQGRGGGSRPARCARAAGGGAA
ncbi:hypothetical protein BH23GEM9_BH23GEM9_08710 [soil metagenome]